MLVEPGDHFSQMFASEVFASVEAAEAPRLARGPSQQPGAVGVRVIAARAVHLDPTCDRVNLLTSAWKLC